MKKLLLNLTLLLIVPALAHSKPLKKNKSKYPSYEIMQYYVIPDVYKNCKNWETNYLNPSFQDANLNTSSNQKISDFQMRYNITKDVMECKLNNQHSLITFPAKISSIEINNEKFEYKSFWNGENYTKGYLHKIYDGIKNVYVRYYSSKVDKKTGIANIKHYLLVEQDGKLPSKIGSAKVIVTALYGSLNKKAKSFLKENQLKLSQPNDLKRIFNYLDTNSTVASR